VYALVWRPYGSDGHPHLVLLGVLQFTRAGSLSDFLAGHKFRCFHRRAEELLGEVEAELLWPAVKMGWPHQFLRSFSLGRAHPLADDGPTFEA
jgi:hypothetical protein